MNNFFQNMGLQISGIIHLSPKETFDVLSKGAFIVDIREEFEIAGKQFDVKNILFIPNKTLKEKFNLLPKDKPLIIADSVGLRSKNAVLFLKENGYENIANLNGGIVDWELDKLPMKIDEGELLTGSCLCKLKPKKSFNK